MMDFVLLFCLSKTIRACNKKFINRDINQLLDRIDVIKAEHASKYLGMILTMRISDPYCH